MSLDSRSTAILSHIAQMQTYVPVRELMEKFKVSRRTIYYDIEKVNDWLKENELCSIKLIRSAGYYLEEETIARLPERLSSLKAWHYEYSLKERKSWLAIYLLGRDSSLFLEDLMEKTYVSRNTTIDDLKGLKVELRRFNLILEFERKSGYVILGDEDSKRKAAVYYLQQILSDQNWQTVIAKVPMILNQDNDNPFCFEKLIAAQSIISDSEKDLNIQYTDEFLHNLSFRLLLFSKRLSQGKKVQIDPVEKEILHDTKHYLAAKEIARKLSPLLGIDFPDDEVLYITKHLLSSRVQFSEELLEDFANHDTLMLSKVVSNMVSDFQKYACVFFKDRKQIEKNLLLHVKSTFYRVKYGLEVENNMSKSIMENFQDIFLITKKVIIHLEREIGKHVNDDETSLIAMHFGGWMKRVGAKPASRKKALIVCTNGVGTSRLLQCQLEGLFSTVDIIGCVSLREYEKLTNEADFIFSTIPLKEKDKPIFRVSPILTEAEKESLLKKVSVQTESETKQNTSVETMVEIIQKYADIHDIKNLQRELRQFLCKPEMTMKEAKKPSLKDLLKKGYILLKDEINDWEKAIYIAAEPLLKDGMITEEYVKEMINNIKKMGPYVVIAPKIAIPHARPENGVNKLSMSLLKLSKAVSFSDKKSHQVNLVIILAVIDGESHLKALSQLTKMFSNERNIKKLCAAISAEEIYELINTYSLDE